MSERVYIEADDAGRILIMAEDEKGSGDGYRIAGPKPCACHGNALHNDDVPYLGIYRLGWDDAIDSAAALVRREFTQPVSPETNGEG